MESGGKGAVSEDATRGIREMAPGVHPGAIGGDWGRPGYVPFLPFFAFLSLAIRGLLLSGSNQRSVGRCGPGFRLCGSAATCLGRAYRYGWFAPTSTSMASRSALYPSPSAV